jgi:hypothetical protein
MTHTRLSLGLLIGVAALGVVLSGLVWLARQQSRRARVLILTQGGAPPSRTAPPAPLCITSHWTTHRTCRMLEERQSPERHLCPRDRVWVNG